MEYQYLLTNKIYDDGDFRYDMNKNKLHFCKDRGEVFLVLLRYMQSLSKVETSREYLADSIVKYANSWIKKNKPYNWELPSQDFGNQHIDFTLEKVRFIITEESVAVVSEE